MKETYNLEEAILAIIDEYAIDTDLYSIRDHLAADVVNEVEENYSAEEREKILVKDPIIGAVLKKFVGRSDLGIDKYGTTLEGSNQTILEFLIHAQEESMDLTNYLEKIIQLEKRRNKTQETVTEAIQASFPSKMKRA